MAPAFRIRISTYYVLNSFSRTCIELYLENCHCTVEKANAEVIYLYKQIY